MGTLPNLSWCPPSNFSLLYRFDWIEAITIEFFKGNVRTSYPQHFLYFFPLPHGQGVFLSRPFIDCTGRLFGSWADSPGMEGYSCSTPANVVTSVSIPRFCLSFCASA